MGLLASTLCSVLSQPARGWQRTMLLISRADRRDLANQRSKLMWLRPRRPLGDRLCVGPPGAIRNGLVECNAAVE